MWITKTSINQPVFATMVMLALVVLGGYSYRLLPVEQMPEINVPQAYVTVAYPGASPEAIENDVIKPLESVINSVEGVKNIYGTAREGNAFLMIDFRMEVDSVAATQEVRDKVAQIRSSLPREVREPTISRATNDSSTEPVVSLVVYSKTRSLREVSTIADQQIVKRLQNSYGVGNVSIGGAIERQVQIFLRPEQLQSFRVGVDQVIEAVRAANQDLPAGMISRGPTEQLVRVEGKMKNPRDFERIIVANQGGAPVYLHQVADIVDGEAEEQSISRMNGLRSVSLDVYKVQAANMVEVGKGVDEAVADLTSRLPPDIVIRTLWSDAKFIEGSLDRVKETIIEGALLTILIVFLFLHSWRSTVITGLTLPISVIASFTALHAFGFTLNFMTLMALSLCIGLLIDDAIVVRENIVRHADMGKSHRAAALEGTSEIGLAVMATTFAILAVFIPVAFMSGVIGKFFLPFGITVAVAVMVSLFVSFTLDPMLSSVWPDPSQGRFRRVPWLGKVMERVESVIEYAHRVYDRLLRWALSGRRYGITRRVSLSPRSLLLLIAAFSFFGSFLLVPKVGTEFVPQQDEGIMFMRMNTPIGSSLEYTDAKIRDAEDAIREIDGVDSILTTVGTDEGRNYARVRILLKDKTLFDRPPQKQIEEQIRNRLSNMAGLSLTVQGQNQPVVISILGPENEKLTELSQELMKRLSTIPGIADLESSERGANPTVAVRIKNELASDLGLTTASIGNALRPLIAGDQISTWLGPDGQDYDVIVQLPKQRREIVSDLGDLYVSSTRTDANGNPMLVPIRQIADFVETTSPQQIKRLNLQRRITIYGNAQGRPSGDVGTDAEKIVKAMQLPPGYRFDVSGAQQEMNETSAAAAAALGLAVIFIYLVLASQFGSFLQPVAIMASLPLSLIGVLLALLFTGTTLNIFSIIGFIMLMGLVTKNAILLVDFTNQAIRNGVPLREAIFEAGQVRLRPILMTTLAMIFGMLPMAIGVGAGGELLAPMGRAVIGGVITSTLLTLLIVPVLYTYIYGFTERVKAYWRRSHAHEASEHAVEPKQPALVDSTDPSGTPRPT
ncbi:efflux RND transporter permease subunit [Steroidobacter agaridevorans]|uniref:efflux RND transporter permease subunit n=1 Tax=Steroidobacter agaridevorans TaxID=2695856 RepID=UPI0013210EE8|nr:efflux RND transporter permease subunit [Steroidobacter agaridevorans]GFE88040.1 nodulation protein NolG [Steroidobacter agaridevorans]